MTCRVNQNISHFISFIKTVMSFSVLVALDIEDIKAFLDIVAIDVCMRYIRINMMNGRANARRKINK